MVQVYIYHYGVLGEKTASGVDCYGQCAVQTTAPLTGRHDNGLGFDAFFCVWKDMYVLIECELGLNLSALGEGGTREYNVVN